MPGKQTRKIQENNDGNEEYRRIMKKTGYEDNNIWKNTPDTIEEFIKDPRFERLDPLAKDAAVAKYLKLSYGKLQAYKLSHNLSW